MRKTKRLKYFEFGYDETRPTPFYIKVFGLQIRFWMSTREARALRDFLNQQLPENNVVKCHYKNDDSICIQFQGMRHCEYYRTGSTYSTCKYGKLWRAK